MHFLVSIVNFRYINASQGFEEFELDGLWVFKRLVGDPFFYSEAFNFLSLMAHNRDAFSIRPSMFIYRDFSSHLSDE